MHLRKLVHSKMIDQVAFQKTEAEQHSWHVSLSQPWHLASQLFSESESLPGETGFWPVPLACSPSEEVAHRHSEQRRLRTLIHWDAVLEEDLLASEDPARAAARSATG